ncbi:MAG TPA: hypothetical protein EYP96_05640 [Nitrosopumilus sp.]|nr:hypothetical protein [Nitrosopumilus sp.]
MNDSLFDDVTSLLDGDFGDDRILKQIARACKNNEVISNYERNYVQKLAEQYLGKIPETQPSKKPENIPPIIHDVVMPKIESSIQTQTFQSPSSRSSNSSSKNSKLTLGVGGVILITIIAAAILFSNNTDSFSNNTDSFLSNPTSDIKVQLSVQTDLSSYAQKDIISINGVSTMEVVNLSIENQNNDLVWAEQISVKSNGMYSTLAIAGGSGWETSGTYTLKVNNGSETKLIQFSFIS